MSVRPIADYAIVSDCHSAALVTKDGAVEWLCFPRFDRPSTFGRLLDDAAGHFTIRPRDVLEVSRRYLDRTMVLETTFRTSSGTAVLTDAMAVGRNERGHDLGSRSPHILVRRIACTDGAVVVDIVYEPRPEYGLVRPILQRVDGGIRARGGAEVLMLSTALALDVRESEATAAVELQAGEAAALALQHRASWESPPRPYPPEEIEMRLKDTIEAWRTWSALHQGYEGPWRDLVHHSGRVLQALTYQPTGAICAAATTSLPEKIGGERNWDYRFCWLRDASLTLEALWVAACPDEAHAFFSHVAGAAASQLRDRSDLQIMFGLGGERDLSERELPHLSGYRGSRPVRVGNDAWRQRQLDVYGELLGAAHLLADAIGGFDDTTTRFLVEAADAAAARWRERDQGIWEVRGDPQEFLYSRLMCWVALERATDLADRLDAHDRVDAWTHARDEIREAIERRGFSHAAHAFAQALGSDELDASSLMIPIVGFLPPGDPRVRATIAAVKERLTDDRGLVYRYRTPDGLAGEEGTFLLCTFWLAQAQALAGDTKAARATFERAIACANDVGLLSEEVDAATGELLGNFPQAFSHIGLVNAAWAIARAEGSAEDG